MNVLVLMERLQRLSRKLKQGQKYCDMSRMNIVRMTYNNSLHISGFQQNVKANALIVTLS